MDLRVVVAGSKRSLQRILLTKAANIASFASQGCAPPAGRVDRLGEEKALAVAESSPFQIPIHAPQQIHVQQWGLTLLY